MSSTVNSLNIFKNNLPKTINHPSKDTAKKDVKKEIFLPLSNLNSSFFVMALCAGVLLLSHQTAAKQNSTIPEWRPQSSEKLVKLPSTYLKKSIVKNIPCYLIFMILKPLLILL